MESWFRGSGFNFTLQGALDIEHPVEFDKRGARFP